MLRTSAPCSDMPQRYSQCRSACLRFNRYGLKSVIQKYSCAMDFNGVSGPAYLDSSSGRETDVGLSVALIDNGATSAMTSAAACEDPEVNCYDQKARMSGPGTQGPGFSRLY